MNSLAVNRILIIVFATVLAAVPLLQAIAELRKGENVSVLRVFDDWPKRDALVTFERAIERESVVAKELRPWMQAGKFFGLKDGGEKVSMGHDGWIYYHPSIATSTQRRHTEDRTAEDALLAVKTYSDELAERGIRLIVVPVPNKESVYPHWFTHHCDRPTRIINPETRHFMSSCAEAGIEVVDLFACYREDSPTPYYLRQDTHWSPHGIEVAAREVAKVIGMKGESSFETQTLSIARHGDLVRMLQSPAIEKNLAPERIETIQVKGSSASHSSVLVLGDSFSRIFQTDEPEDAGFVAHLAKHLGQPVASLVNDGGASTLVRQELVRRPQLLDGVKVVVWEFTERDLRLGIGGWQIVPLPPHKSNH